MPVLTDRKPNRLCVGGLADRLGLPQQPQSFGIAGVLKNRWWKRAMSAEPRLLK